MTESGIRRIRVPCNGLVQRVERVGVSLFQRFHDAAVDVVFQHQSPRAVQGGTNRRQLNEHFAAIAVVLHHPLHRLQMPDDPGETVDHRFLFLGGVDMGVFPAVHMALAHSSSSFPVIPCPRPFVSCDSTASLSARSISSNFSSSSPLYLSPSCSTAVWMKLSLVS